MDRQNGLHITGESAGARIQVGRGLNPGEEAVTGERRNKNSQMHLREPGECDFIETTKNAIKE